MTDNPYLESDPPNREVPPELLERIEKLARDVQPYMADYKRFFAAWVDSDQRLMQAYSQLAERMASGEFGFDTISLQLMLRMVEADETYNEAGVRLRQRMDSYVEIREQLRALVNRLSSRMVYELSMDLTDPDHDAKREVRTRRRLETEAQASMPKKGPIKR